MSGCISNSIQSFFVKTLMGFAKTLMGFEMVSKAIIFPKNLPMESMHSVLWNSMGRSGKTTHKVVIRTELCLDGEKRGVQVLTCIG